MSLGSRRELLFGSLDKVLNAFVNQHLGEVAAILNVEVCSRLQGIVKRLLVIVEVKVEL